MVYNTVVTAEKRGPQIAGAQIAGVYCNTLVQNLLICNFLVKEEVEKHGTKPNLMLCF